MTKVSFHKKSKKNRIQFHTAKNKKRGMAKKSHANHKRKI